MPRALREVRDAVRSLLRDPGTAWVAVLTLGLGVGAAAWVFSVAWQVLARPLPYPVDPADPARGELVAVFATEAGAPGERKATSPGNFYDLARSSDSVIGWTAARVWSPTLSTAGSISGAGQAPEQVPALLATPGLFDLLGVRPRLGSVFGGTSFGPEGGDERVAVISHALWRGRFGGDPEVVGRTVALDGESYTVTGVMPPGFEFPPFWAREAELWAPLLLAPEEAASRGASYLRVFGRLAPGRTLADARREVEGLMAGLATAHPDANQHLGAVVEPLREPVVQGVRGPLRLLAWTVALVLLVACSNVAGLLLMRAAHREGEQALRVALGAPPGELVRRELIHSLVLGCAGGLVGWALAVGGIATLQNLRPPGLPRVDELAVDGAVLALAAGLALAAALLAGALPALRAVRRGTGAAIRSSARDGDRGRDRLWRPVVAAQVAMTVLLLTGAALLGRSLVALTLEDPGFRAAGLVTADLPFGGTEHADGERQAVFFRRLLAEVEAQPGIESATLVNHLPVGGDTWRGDLQIESRPDLDPPPKAVMRVVGPGYFETMGIERVAGPGDFDTMAAERPDGPGVVVVNRALAALLPGEAVGARLRLGAGAPGDPWLTVAGVVADARQESLRERPAPEIYFPYSQNPFTWFHQTTLVARAAAGPGVGVSDVAGLTGSLRAAVTSVDPTIPVVRPRPVADVLSADLQATRFLSGLLGVFAAVSLTLSGVGLYGQVSHRVRRQRREIGIRMSLGADRRRVLRMVLAQALTVVVAGLVPGLAAAFLLTRSLGDLLYEVAPADPSSFAAAVTVLVAAGAVAAWLPARWATAIEPAETLRAD